ncbi:hypothetical protein [Lactococcus lactis]|uniref:hypothetical protein n=1 Tax=Lactococcus lactis TaxID=1358 RepID=UPI00223BD1BE|nr:hypothetical protein [Lactococcus lactis]
MSGVKIDDYLKVLQSKYQVTADVENRTLNFNEVKKELDAGQMIQMDAYDQNETLPQGSEGNEGHALAIVGYILPADGDTAKHAPYYEVWNPWWGNTFYVSSKASYFNLEGTQYKWTRTWHNWRKVGTGATVQTNPAVAQQKVASAVNPNAKPIYSKPTPFNPLGKNINNQNVCNFGKPTAAKTLDGTVYEAMISLDKSTIFASKIVSSNPKNKIRSYGKTAQKFVSNIEGMISTQVDIEKWGFTNAILFTLFAIAQAIPVFNVAVDAISLTLTTLWGGGIGAEDITLLVSYIINFINYQNGASSCFNSL